MNLKRVPKSSKNLLSNDKPKSKKDHKKSTNSINKNLSKHNSQNILSSQNKKLYQISLSTKKIQDLQVPDLIIKILYKGKKLNIPIQKLTNKNLSQTVMPHVVQFQQQILKNQCFNPEEILSWKCKTDCDNNYLKDFYLQTELPLFPFKNTILEIEPITNQHKIQRLSLKDFQIIKCIGTGGFSAVFLSRRIRDGKFFALKLMDKQQLQKGHKIAIATNQRDIMTQLNHPNIVSLQFSFQSKYFLVLGLQYCPGGELFHYLRTHTRLQQEQARYCLRQIIDGIQYLHNNNIIYRDMKPQNIMIDYLGNIKIADFGLSKEVIGSERCYTECGSPEYIVPQILNKEGHFFELDYYLIGAILYEMIVGFPPFYSEKIEEIYQGVKSKEISFPQYIPMSQQLKQFLRALLNKNPKKRLGALAGLKQIKMHPWMRKNIKNQEAYPFKINLLKLNINQTEIAQRLQQTNIINKLQKEDINFEEIFQHFYFDRISSGISFAEISPDYLQSMKKNKQTTKNNPLNQNQQFVINQQNTTVKKSKKYSLSMRKCLNKSKTAHIPLTSANKQLKDFHLSIKKKKKNCKKQLSLHKSTENLIGDLLKIQKKKTKKKLVKVKSMGTLHL